jgi:hypothetical protein
VEGGLVGAICKRFTKEAIASRWLSSNRDGKTLIILQKRIICISCDVKVVIRWESLKKRRKIQKHNIYYINFEKPELDLEEQFYRILERSAAGVFTKIEKEGLIFVNTHLANHINYNALSIFIVIISVYILLTELTLQM